MLKLQRKEASRALQTNFLIIFSGGKGLQTILKRLVTEPLKDFDDFMGTKGAFAIHESNQYHKQAVEAGKTFLTSFHNPSLSKTRNG